MQIAVPTDRLKPADACIYCGATDDLTDEHIIPFGLWGRLVYPDASCRPCAKIINVFERQVMQDHLGGFRARAKIPLRRNRPREYKFTLTFATTRPNEKPKAPVEISGDEFPRRFLMPRFMPAHLSTGHAWPQAPALWLYENNDDSTALMEKYGNYALFSGSYENDKFCRQISKIAHSFTYGHMSKSVMGTFEPLLLDVILGKDSEFHRLVGGDFTVPPVGTKWLHEIDVSNAVHGDTEYLFSRVRLFAPLGTPRYHAVVAKRPLGATTVTADPVRL